MPYSMQPASSIWLVCGIAYIMQSFTHSLARSPCRFNPQTLEREKVRQNVLARSSGLEAGGDVLEDEEEGGAGPSSSEMMMNANTIVEEEVQAYVPEVDDEGFETVARGKRTRSNKRYG
mgnify:CR=1 FL=1